MTKGKLIFWSAISATVLIGGYFTYKYYKNRKGDGQGSGEEDKDKDTGSGDNSQGATPPSTKPPIKPEKDSGQVGAKPTGTYATIKVYSTETPLFQNIEDATSFFKSAIIKYPIGSQNKRLGEVINTGSDKSGTKWYYLKLDTKAIKDGKTYWNGWVNEKLVDVK